MNNSNIINLPNEIILEYMKTLPFSDLNNVITTHSKFKLIYEQNEEELFDNLIQKEYGLWTKNSKALYIALRSNKDFRKPKRVTLIRHAIEHDNPGELKTYLRDFKFDINTLIKPLVRETALSFAVRMWQIPTGCVKVMLNLGANINHTASDGSTPLMDLMVNHTIFPDILLQMLRMNPDLNVRNMYAKSVCHFAFNNVHMDLRIINRLLNMPFDANIQDNRQNTPLHYLLRRHSNKLSQMSLTAILKKNVDFNLQNSTGDTILMLAIKNARRNVFLRNFILEILKVPGLDLNLTDATGLSATMHALQDVNFPKRLVIEMLNHPNVNVNLQTPTSRQSLAMMCMISADANDYVDIILEKGDFNLVNSQNNTIVMQVVKNNSLNDTNILKLLTKTNNVNQTNSFNQTFLDIALAKIKSDFINNVIEYLLESTEDNLLVTSKTLSRLSKNLHVLSRNIRRIRIMHTITTSESD